MTVDKLKLLMGRKIPFKDLYIHQPLISEIVDIGEDEYNKLVLPFVITTELVFGELEDCEKYISKYNIFDLFFLKIEEDKTLLDDIFDNKALDLLASSLSYFFKTDNIKILNHREKIVIEENLIVDKDVFGELRLVVQEICSRKDIEVERPPKNMTRRQKDIWLKLQAGRKRTAERNAIYLQDIINAVHLNPKTYISLKEIDSMTHYQLFNAYRSINAIDVYEVSMQYKLSPKFDVKDKVKDWRESIKIGK